ncbi:hypothetical protein OC610_00895 [Pseudomonas sp. SAICEU22]|uniref:Uncharacterized protein n=1 Tax=Pseudomonas agronomica TaxID=2979328 RepID=A0ABT3F1J3_9PSED|nr:hypothetical protein [Pseudomonas agronomica]MCW1242951.1 hypothetical protein [Pseudomonas agronomica]
MDHAQIISVFGIAVPVCSVVVAWFWKTHHERKAVKIAIIAEILALKEIATERGYETGLMQTAVRLREIAEAEREKVRWQVAVPEHYCRVYVANISKLGALKLRDAGLIVKFYQYADSVIRDVSQGGILYKGSSDPQSFEENAAILRLALDIAAELEERNPM